MQLSSLTLSAALVVAVLALPTPQAPPENPFHENSPNGPNGPSRPKLPSLPQNPSLLQKTYDFLNTPVILSRPSANRPSQNRANTPSGARQPSWFQNVKKSYDEKVNGNFPALMNSPQGPEWFGPATPQSQPKAVQKSSGKRVQRNTGTVTGGNPLPAAPLAEAMAFFPSITAGLDAGAVWRKANVGEAFRKTVSPYTQKVADQLNGAKKAVSDYLTSPSPAGMAANPIDYGKPLPKVDYLGLFPKPSKEAKEAKEASLPGKLDKNTF
ncbi:MAG: hypothetical protein M1816_001032 [Peltula sp. TS41687]|nr:MAG: hypothetical protein M1816_001032 [Peltula sp. TS41687]